MKFSIRSKFTSGLVFLLIILALSIYSAYYMNKASNESGVILKENYLSLVYARDMAEGLTKINQELSRSFLLNKQPDLTLVKNHLQTIEKSFQAEKDNITEPGEDQLVSIIATDLKAFSDSVLIFKDSRGSEQRMLFLQKKFEVLYQHLMNLSLMNGKAIEVKTDNTKISTQDAVTQMSVIATMCFIIALFYSYSFSSFSGEKFNQLYDGIKKLGLGNYRHRLDFEETDKFYEISLVINEMAEKLAKNEKIASPSVQIESKKTTITDEITAFKNILERIKIIETDAEILLGNLEDKV